MAKPSELLLRYAECSDGESSYDSAVEDEFYNGQDPWDENPYKGRVFHKFAELPPELRIKIWGLGLSSLTQPQLLHFNLKSVVRIDTRDMVPDERGMPNPRRYRDWTINGSPNLARATELNRSVMAVNREARDVAHKLLPHTLKIRTLGGDGIVYFDRNRDVVQLSGYNYDAMHPFPIGERFQDFVYHFDGFAENVMQLAVHYNAFYDEDEDTSNYFTHAFQQFQNLKRLFLLASPDRFVHGENIVWCGSEYIYMHTSMITDGRNEPLWTKWCWPNADEYDDFIRQQVCEPVKHLLPDSALPLLRTRGIELLPMVEFEDKYGINFLEKLKKKWHRTYAEGIMPTNSDLSSDEDREEESGSDEYESDGIDDSPIEENGGNDDSGDDIYDEEYDSENDDYSGAGEAEIVPVFSSPEPDPDVAGGATNSRKRRIVLDSDDEDGDTSERLGRKHDGAGSFTETDGGAKNAFSVLMDAGRGRKRAAVVDSDDEKDEGDGKDDAFSRLMGVVKRSRKRAAIIDSDDDEEGGGGAINGNPDEHETSKKEGNDGRGEDDDEKEEEEEEIMDVRRLSLASRLQNVRESHPSSDEDSTREEDSDDIGDEEDDEDKDEDEDEEMYGGGLIDGHADESDDSGGY
ncbi:hypothetical protein HDV63DRAFT_327592 [Trichoderma sp. SZMC 28014]